jgi:hypothetical protein
MKDINKNKFLQLNSKMHWLDIILAYSIGIGIVTVGMFFLGWL